MAVLLSSQTSFTNLAWWRFVDLERKTEHGIEDMTGDNRLAQLFQGLGSQSRARRTFAPDEKTMQCGGNPGNGQRDCPELSFRRSLFGGDASVVYRKWLDILSPLFALFPLGPTGFDPFQPVACPLNFSHYLFDRRRPHERSGCFVPRLQELFNGLL